VKRELIYTTTTTTTTAAGNQHSPVAIAG